MKAVRAGKVSFAGDAWKGVSESGRDFITQCLTYNQDQRPTASELLQHQWIVELAKVAVDEAGAIGALRNLKNFRADQTLKQATYAYVASQLLSKQKKEELAKVFKAFDKNGDGRLGMEEVK